MESGRAGPQGRRELLLLRHAKSDWDTDAPDDAARPLSPRGRRAAASVGAWMNDGGLLPDHVVCSTAVRAQQTLERVLRELDEAPASVRDESRVYGASPADLLVVLGEVPEHARRVLLVGHNPGLESLVVELAGSSWQPPSSGSLFPTAALARLEVPCAWSALAAGAGPVTLLDLVRPRELG